MRLLDVPEHLPSPADIRPQLLPRVPGVLDELQELAVRRHVLASFERGHGELSRAVFVVPAVAARCCGFDGEGSTMKKNNILRIYEVYILKIIWNGIFILL